MKASIKPTPKLKSDLASVAPAVSLSLAEARALALQATGLSTRTGNKSGLGALVEQLGYVQIDAISVIERAHHHVLWSRVKGYRPDWLNEMLAARQVFEYWGHAASYLPFADYRYYLPLMQGFVARSKWASQRLEVHGHLIPEILARIQSEGPLAARDFEQSKRPAAGWWNWKPAKIALELLYWQGQIMVCRRDGFDKVYDLAERVIPQQLDTSLPSPAELADFCLRRALLAYGVASFKEIRRHLPLSGQAELKAALAAGLESGRVLLVQLEAEPEAHYALASTLAQPLPKVPASVHLLSPFDHLVIQRGRFAKLFGGDYQFEAYVPAAKRRYGYFSLPLLYGDELLGYLDLKAHRQKQLLEVKQATWIRELNKTERQAMLRQLERFARFNGCERLDGFDKSI